MAVIDSTVVINGIRLAEQGSNPSSPAAGYEVIFAKSDGLYIKDSSGTVTGPFAGGGATAIGVAGWVTEGNTWTYSSADGATGIVSVNADLTGVLSPGMRVKLTQTTVKYFI